MGRKAKKAGNPDLMTRTRATVGLLNSSQYEGRKDAQVFAFLSIFHPEIPIDKAKQMSNSVRDR